MVWWTQRGTDRVGQIEKVSLTYIHYAYSHGPVQLFATPWTIDCPAPLSMGILQAKILEWVACPPPRDLPNPGMEPRSSALQEDSSPAEPPTPG